MWFLAASRSLPSAPLPPVVADLPALRKSSSFPRQTASPHVHLLTQTGQQQQHQEGTPFALAAGGAQLLAALQGTTLAGSAGDNRELRTHNGSCVCVSAVYPLELQPSICMFHKAWNSVTKKPQEPSSGVGCCS